MSDFLLPDHNAHALATARTANPTAVTTGSAVDVLATTIGVPLTLPYALPEATFRANVTLTTTADSELKAAGAAGIRNYLVGLQYQNTNATATSVLIKDGASTIASFQATANMALPAVITFPVPLRGSAATALNVAAGTTAASVFVNAQGFSAP